MTLELMDSNRHILTAVLAASRQRYTPLRVTATVTALLLALALLAGNWTGVAALDRDLQDLRIAYAGAADQERRVVIVDIDEASLQAVGSWPWPRATLAKLIETLFERYDVALVALDIVFPEARPGDERLRAAFARYPVVVAQTFYESAESNNRLGVLAPGIDIKGPAPVTTGYLANTASLQVSGQAVGHITPRFDPDGVVRRIQPVLCFDAACIPSLSLRVFMQLMGATGLRYESSVWRPATWRLDPEVGASIPLNRDGQLLIPWNADSSHLRAIAAHDVLSGNIRLDEMRNGIVIIGSTAFGLGDRVPAPNRALAPGVEIHVQLLSAMLDNRLPRVLTMPIQVLLLFLLAAILPAFTGREAGVMRLLLMSLGIGTAIVSSDWIAWHFALLVIPSGALLSLVAASFLLLAPLEARRLRNAFRQFRQNIGAFVPDAIAARLADPERSADPDLKNIEISVLFADVRGFTGAMEKLSADRAALLANRLLAEMSAVVDRYGGTIEKFTGDGLMAIWESGAENQPLHARVAVACGLALRDTIHDGLRDWLNLNEFAPLDLVIGINSGIAAVGVYGSDTRKAYSAHGDMVNVAQRLEMLTRETGEFLLMGEATAKELGMDKVHLVGEFPVKGRQGKVRAYAPLCAAPPMASLGTALDRPGRSA